MKINRALRGDTAMFVGQQTFSVDKKNPTRFHKSDFTIFSD